ncbi:MAG: Holliday junction branch migration protein RuvA [Parvularculaceae bacterium]
MIGRLKGMIAAVGEETALIDVAGVGYEVCAAPRTLQRLAVGDAATLAIETHVREDLIRLYAFESETERQCFRLLQGVQGVGARHALSVLQVLAPDDLYDAVAAEDAAAVARAHGVGKKLAQRIVAELSSKVGALAGGGAGFAVAARQAASAGREGEGSIRADAAAALCHLGYEGVEARRAVAGAAAALGAEASVEALIKGALKELASA